LLENVALPLRLNGHSKSDATEQAFEWLDRLRIGPLADRRPGEVSGGEMQRAAVARSLIHSPGIVYCDEPTGSLDTENGKIVLDLLVGQARDLGAATMIVTHNEDLTALADRVLHVTDGRVVEN
jgi:putative ABC transport system ATP-binding protein